MKHFNFFNSSCVGETASPLLGACSFFIFSVMVDVLFCCFFCFCFRFFLVFFAFFHDGGSMDVFVVFEKDVTMSNAKRTTVIIIIIIIIIMTVVILYG